MREVLETNASAGDRQSEAREAHRQHLDRLSGKERKVGTDGQSADPGGGDAKAVDATLAAAPAAGASMLDTRVCVASDQGAKRRPSGPFSTPAAESMSSRSARGQLAAVDRFFDVPGACDDERNCSVSASEPPQAVGRSYGALPSEGDAAARCL